MYVDATNLMNAIIAHSRKAKKFSVEVEKELKEKFL